MDPLAGVDLNLLVALHALLEEQHVTRAARRMGTSQPAMSRSLARLRDLLDDPLLVRVAGRMRLTPRAEALMPALSAWLADTGALLAPVDFDPALASGRIRLALPDVLVLQLVPGLLNRLGEVAPGLSVDVVGWNHDFVEHLISGTVDLTVGGPVDVPGLYATRLVENEWVTVVRRGHPALDAPWTPEAFADLPHLLVRFSRRGGGQVDEALAALGLTRRVVLGQPYSALAPLLVKSTDLVLTTARWLAEALRHDDDLVLRPPPLALEPVSLHLLWHHRTHHHPEQRWIRSVLTDVASAF